MTAGPGNRRLAILATVVFAVVLGGRPFVDPGPVEAAPTVSFGAASATSTFEVGIDLTEPATLPAGVRRVEALVRTGTSSLRFVVDIPVPGSGATTLSYRFATPAGDLIPNTVVELQFRVTLADGSQEVGPSASVRYSDTRFSWSTLSGRVVRVHWVLGDDTFGRRALAIGEKAVDDVSRLLGVVETEPIDFFIYPDAQSFYDVLGPGTRENVGGVAFPDIRTLLANIGPNAVNDPWVGIVIPHELTHLVFGTAVDNPFHQPPHWFNEGLAVYLSQGYDDSDRSAVAAAGGNGSLMPLTAIDGQFPTTADRFSLAYAESTSAIDFLVRTYGQAAMVTLIRSYAGGVTDDEAFKAGLGVDVAGFQAAWLADLGVPEPTAFGPRPAPAGPVPADWGGAAPTPGSVGTGSAAPAPGSPAGSDLDALILESIVVALVTIGAIGLFAVLARRRRVREGRPPGSDAP
ncbi:MAG: peptidase MA family metallohydrolase [Candidatus Limnocylindrales bacterium]